VDAACGFDGGSVRLRLRDLEQVKVTQVAEVLRSTASERRSDGVIMRSPTVQFMRTRLKQRGARQKKRE
jgi:hypothetical protein